MSQLTNFHGHEIEQKSEARRSNDFLQPLWFYCAVVNKVMGSICPGLSARARRCSTEHLRVRCGAGGHLRRVFLAPVGWRTASCGDGPVLAVFGGRQQTTAHWA